LIREQKKWKREETAKLNKRIYSIDNTALSQRSTKHYQKEEIEKRRETTHEKIYKNLSIRKKEKRKKKISIVQ